MTELVKCRICKSIVEESKTIIISNDDPILTKISCEMLLMNLHVCKSHFKNGKMRNNQEFTQLLINNYNFENPCFIWDLKTSEKVRLCDEKELILCLMKSNVIKRPSCQKCQQLMKPKFRSVRGNSWICRRKGKDCSSASMKQATIFSNSHIKLIDQISIAISWLNGCKLSEISDCAVSRRTIIDQIHHYRLECIKYWKNIKIGGPNIGIELKMYDLSKIGFDQVDQYFFVLIAIERKEKGQVFIDFLPKITKEAVHDFLSIHINPGSYLMCDDWRNLLFSFRNLNIFSNSTNFEIKEAIQILESGNYFEMEIDEEIKDESIQNDFEKNETEVDFSIINSLLFGNNSQKISFESSFENCEHPEDGIETAQEFFDYLISNLSFVWRKMNKQEKEEIIAEKVMRFNGRENPHKFFWEMLVSHYSQ